MVAFRYITKYIMVGVFITVFGTSVSGQNVNKEFDAFLQEVEAEYKQFTDSINLVFAEFIKQNWDSYDVYSAEEAPSFLLSNNNHDNESVSPPCIYQEGDFFGIELSAQNMNHVFHTNGVRINGVSENDVGELWKALATYDGGPIFTQMKECIDLHRLNFWGAYMYANSCYCGKYEMESNENVVFSVFFLNQLGYKCRIGRKSGKLLLLANLNIEIYSVPYVMLDGARYYIFEQLVNYGVGSKVKMQFENAPVYTYSKDYDLCKESGNMLLSKEHRIPKVIDFYNYYPLCHLRVYLTAHLSDFSISVFEQAKNEIAKKGITPQTQRRKYIEELFKFVNLYSNYRTDQQKWGKERYFFTDEWIYYKESDCEDNSIALYSLFKYCRVVSPILLLFKKHAAIAIDLPPLQGEQYISYKGKKYLICDPSFRGAGVGCLVSETDVAQGYEVIE